MAYTQELKTFEYGSLTHVGKVRKNNEDYLGYFDTLNGHIFVICDGMGGHVGGERAAILGVNSIKYFFSNFFYDNPQLALKDAINYANKIIYEESIKEPELFGMGTTIVIAIIKEYSVYYAHVGDSRIYYYTGNNLFQITKDHSVVQKLIDANLITPDDAETHPRKNEIYQALGTNNEIEISVCKEPIDTSAGDILLLCSDGLNSMLNDYEIAEILQKRIRIPEKASKLIQQSNKLGGYDNITVHLIQFFDFSFKNYPESKSLDFRQKTKNRTRNSLVITILFVTIVTGLILYYAFFENKNRANAKRILFVSNRNTTILNTINYELNPDENIDDVIIRFGITREMLNKYNKLPNKQLIIPIRTIHNVGFNDNLEIISKKYNVPIEAILKANQLNTLDISDKIEIIVPKIKVNDR